MTLYTMGFTQKSAEVFFELIKKNDIDLLLDVRLNNQSQLAGFTKGKDLSYFLDTIVGCRYIHDIAFAPTKELLNDYKKNNIVWEEYVSVFNKLIENRNMVKRFVDKYMNYKKVLLLCSESSPNQCHRRLVAEAISAEIKCDIIHL